MRTKLYFSKNLKLDGDDFYDLRCRKNQWILDEIEVFVNEALLCVRRVNKKPDFAKRHDFSAPRVIKIISYLLGTALLTFGMIIVKISQTLA